MPQARTIRSTVAGLVLLAFYGTWLAMEWTGREPDTVVLLGAVAIVLGAAFYLWDDAMGEGVQAVDDLQNATDNETDDS